MELLPIDHEAIAFLAARRGVDPAIVRRHYAAAKQLFRFAGSKYRQWAVGVHTLMRPIHGQENEAELIASYQWFAPVHLYRHISYVYYRQGRFARWAQWLDEQLGPEPPRVIDYGCGLAHLTLALAERRPDTTAYLLDVDSLVLDFCAWRFQQRGLRYEVIRATAKKPYPRVPAHNICLATSVMEHLREPLRAYAHIRAAMVTGGLLIGNFGDHGIEPLHVSCDLTALRAAIAQDYRPGPRPSVYVRQEHGDG